MATEHCYIMQRWVETAPFFLGGSHKMSHGSFSTRFVKGNVKPEMRRTSRFLRDKLGVWRDKRLVFDEVRPL